MNILIWIILVVLCSILYRMGGAHGYNSKYRDIGCPVCVAIIVFLFGGFHWSGLVSTALMFGAMTTYWKNEPDAKWYHWFITGLMYAVSWLPYCVFTGNQLGFAIYAIIVSIGTVLWSEAQDNVVWEECGRGFIVAFFAPILADTNIINLFTKGLAIK